MAFRIARHERPFTIELIAILPEHLHVIWTLPSGDADFSGRWKRIKAHLTHRLAAPARRSSAIAMADTHFGNGAFGSTRYGTSLISSGTSTTSTSIRSSTSWFVGCALAIFVVSRVCQARSAASRLGGRRRRVLDGFRRTESLNPDFASLHPGYLVRSCGLFATSGVGYSILGIGRTVLQSLFQTDWRLHAAPRTP
jgi:hypothetical protein